ncbi:MAG TPA: flagellar motor protein MotB [Pirellulaceae bacterium]|nr:flagellar motor protein MotB [Pirellulaceae bacterium]HMO91527.1 flagellar motor protein MotB [Pirellulaceae bacterium]HMP68224.1 flagellar motor protein MotB [Pirellulaceae bacterium]
MSRSAKAPPKKPSKSYLISFGDTMTALLAFFIVLNSLAKDQTGAQLYSGTGSFVTAFKRTGVAGNRPGSRSDIVIPKVDQAPIYAIQKNDPSERKSNRGPDDDDTTKVVKSRERDNFARFLNEMQYQFEVHAAPPIQAQIVFDSFEKLGAAEQPILGPNALQLLSDAVQQASNSQFELEIIVWANLPSPGALSKAMASAQRIEQLLDNSFRLHPEVRKRISITAKNWLFFDAKRPKMSFVLSRLDIQ